MRSAILRDGTSAATRGSEFDVSPTINLITNDPLVMRVFPGSFHTGQTHFLFCDGSVHPLKWTLNQTVWYGLITRYGREVISQDAYQ